MVNCPVDVFFSCGNTSYTYIPANTTGGPCAIIIGVPGLAVGYANAIKRLACAMAKAIYHTSIALEGLLANVKSLRGMTLQNRAAIDYLLLKHNHGCEEFEGMCCFNLSDHSKSNMTIFRDYMT
ncbi:uncharacterized protein WCC33_009038 [Rhinophrynus dorsalis]